MQKSFKTTLVLAAFLVGLVVWYNVYEKKIKIQNTEKEEKTKQLLSVEENDVREITIQRMTNAPKDDAPTPAGFTPTYETIKFQKNGADWAMTAPVEDAADQANVKSMLSSVLSSKQERIVDENPKDLEAFGLNKPVARIQILKEGAKAPEEVSLGANTPVGFSSYAKTSNGAPVFKVSRGLKSAVEKDALHYRNKQLVSWKRDEVIEIELDTAKENTVLKKDDKGGWTLARENLPAESNEANKTLSALVDLRAQTISSDKPTNLSGYGLSQPAVKATLAKKDGTRFKVLVGQTKDKFYAKREDKPTVYEIAKTSVDPLLRPSSAYKDLSLAHFNRFDVKHIKVEKGEGSFELVKGDGEGAGWNFPGESTTKIDTAEVDTFLTKLQDTKITKYLSVKDSPRLKEPKLVVRLFEKKDKEEKETLLLTFTSPQNKEVLVQRKGLDILLALKEEDFKKVNVPKTSFVQQEKKPEKIEEKKEP